MSVLNSKSNKGINVYGRAEIFNEVYSFNLHQIKGEPNKFTGWTKTTEEGSVSRKITWDIEKYDVLTITVPGATPEEGEEIKKIAEKMSARILKSTRNKKFFDYYNEVKKNGVIIESNNSNIIDEDDVNMEKNIIKEEIAVTKELPKTAPPKRQVSEDVKSFMKQYELTNAIDALEFAVAKYNDSLEDIALLEERLTNTKPEDPDDDPNDGQSISAIDYAELKAELKTEILAELREEMKASLSTTATTIKESTKVKLPVTKEAVITKTEEKVEKPKTKKLSELTLDDLNNMEYLKLQKLGSKLKLGSGNVTNKAELVNKIAIKLKLVKQDTAEEEVTVESLNITKINSKFSEIRANNDYTEDCYDIEEELLLDEPIEKEIDIIDQIANTKYDDPAKQKLADVILKRKGLKK
jgi:hypothetical protein